MGATLRKLMSNRDGLALLLLGAFVVAMYLPNLGAYAFWDPWEPHYAQVAKEMADHGTWMDPTYRGQNRWWSKPILPLWGLRLSFAVFGVDGPDDPWLHLAGRLPVLLFALIGVLLTFRWVSRLYARRAGVYAALVLATCPMYALLAHQVMFDMPFVVFCASAIGYYVLARSPAGRPGDLVVFAVLCGCAFLSKWLLAFFIPAGILLAYLVLRWDTGFFRRVGRRVWLGSGVVLIAAAGYFFFALDALDRVDNLAFAGLLTLSVLAFLFVFWMIRDAVSEMGHPASTLWIGLGALLVIILPWHLYMIVKHGWPFLREAVVYHHFHRAAGTIGKPEGTFDVYVQQLFFATYPWVALLPAALIKLLTWSSADLEGAGRRNLWLFLAAAVPYAAFSLFQTKFHHYIFPVVPFVAVIIGVYLDRAAQMDDRAWMRLSVALGLPIAAVLLADSLHDYKVFIHLFDYYYGWPLPAQLNPYPIFGALGAIWLAILSWLFFRRRLGAPVVAVMTAVAASLCVVLTAWILPRVTDTFTQEPLYRAYLRATDGKAPIAQYNGWLSRSVSFYFDNRAEDLSRSDQPNLEKTVQFLRRPGRSFLILGAGHGRDCRSLLADLRPKIRGRIDRSLYVVFDQHPFSCLVSTDRDPEGEQRVREKVLTDLPAGVRRMQVNFDDKIELLGYRLFPAGRVAPGQRLTVTYFFRCQAPVGDDWLVFIHGDGPHGGSHRVFGDHAPLGGLYPTSEWRAGEIIQDDHEMIVPANYPYKGFTLWMGFWKGPRRLEVTRSHQHDGNHRVRTAYIQLH